MTLRVVGTIGARGVDASSLPPAPDSDFKAAQDAALAAYVQHLGQKASLCRGPPAAARGVGAGAAGSEAVSALVAQLQLAKPAETVASVAGELKRANLKDLKPHLLPAQKQTSEAHVELGKLEKYSVATPFVASDLRKFLPSWALVGGTQRERSFWRLERAR